MKRPLPGQPALLQENFFDHTCTPAGQPIPLPDELFVSSWQEYIKEIKQHNLLKVLAPKLVQLNFPVQEGMSQNIHYQSAVKKGEAPSAMAGATGVQLRQPGDIKVYLYQTAAGKIPVLEVPDRADFTTMVQALAYKNEPAALADSMGACMIKGYNNWDRMNKYREKWYQDHGGEENINLLWFLEFDKIKSQKELYRDTFIILNHRPYSNVPAAMLGLAPDQWRRLSLIIRREHEATHYCTMRFWGSARNHLLDEIIADYMGIIAATGHFKAHWLLCFMGLEDYPAYRQGGRLTNYLKDHQLSEQEWEMVKHTVYRAAHNLERFTDPYTPAIKSGDYQGQYQMLKALTRLNLKKLATWDMK